jgi:hypothetical protein
VLGTPVVLFAVFLAIGASIPENQKRANAVRRLCDTLLAEGRTTQYECDRAYSSALSKGQESTPVASPPVPGVTQADIDAALADGAKKANEPYKAPVYPKPNLYGEKK